jgi:hypothetical protein
LAGPEFLQTLGPAEADVLKPRRVNGLDRRPCHVAEEKVRLVALELLAAFPLLFGEKGFSGPGDAASAPVGSGSYAGTATPPGPDGKPGNDAVHEAEAALAVDPAGLTVTAGGRSMTCGGVPALACKRTGPAHGGAGAAFTGGPATTATSGSTVGGYPTTQGAPAGTGNYTIGTFNGGTPAVNPATLSYEKLTGAFLTSTGTPPLPPAVARP